VLVAADLYEREQRCRSPTPLNRIGCGYPCRDKAATRDGENARPVHASGSRGALATPFIGER
jgi:hypothetical protein